MKSRLLTSLTVCILCASFSALFAQKHDVVHWEETPWDEQPWETPWEEHPSSPSKYTIPSEIINPQINLSEDLSNQATSFDESIDQEEEEELNEEPKRYRLKIGDALLVGIYGEPDTRRQVIVDPTGSISYLYVHSLPAIGMTISELRAELEEKLKTYYRFAVLSLTPIQFSGAYYTIMGEVKAPGRKPLGGGATVTSALCQARGLTLKGFRDQIVEQADLEHSFLVRNGEYIPVDFVKLIKEGDLSQDVPLKSGDYLYIERGGTNNIFIFGEIGGAAKIEFMNRISLAEAIADVGGISPNASSRAVVIRGSLACPVRYLIDINRIFKGYACDFPLESGDIVYIPPRKFSALRDLFYSAIRDFVGTVGSAAGSDAFYKLHSHDRDHLEEPVRVFPFNSFQQTQVVQPPIQ